MTASTTAEPPAQQSDAVPRRAWAVLAVVLVAEVMDLVDGTVVNVAGPAVRQEIGGSTAFLQWLAFDRTHCCEVPPKDLVVASQSFIFLVDILE